MSITVSSIEEDIPEGVSSTLFCGIICMKMILYNIDAQTTLGDYRIKIVILGYLRLNNVSFCDL